MLDAAAVSIVRAAVSATPGIPENSVHRYLSYTGTFVAEAVRRGVPQELYAIFDPDRVKSWLDDAKKEGKSPPYRSTVAKVAEAFGYEPEEKIGALPLKAHYTADDVDTLLSSTFGMVGPYSPALKRKRRMRDTATDVEAAILLGVLYGLYGSAASDVLGSDFKVRSGTAFLWVASRQQMLAAGGRHVEWLADVVGRRPGLALTQAYTSSGKQRVRRAWSKSSQCPDYKSQRLLATYYRVLVEHDVPIDIIAYAADVTPNAAARRCLDRDVPPQRILAELGADSNYRPSAPVSRFRTGFPPRRPASVTEALPRRSVDDLIAARIPKNPAARQMWIDVAVEFLAPVVRRRATTPRYAKDILDAASNLVTWAASQPHFEADPEELFHEDTVREWRKEVQAAGALEQGSVAKYESCLKAIGRSWRPTSRGRIRSSPPPFTAQDRKDIESYRRDLDGADRLLMDAFDCLCEGGGASVTEAKRARIQDADTERGTVTLGRSRRVIPIDRRFIPTLRRIVARAQESGSEYLTGVDPDAHSALPVLWRLVPLWTPQRARATWLLRHLQRGVPYPVLRAGAGTDLWELDRLCLELQPRSEAEILAWLASATAAYFD